VSTDQPNQQFTCPACGHLTTFDPAACWQGVKFSKDYWGSEEKVLFVLVRCAGCGKEHEVPTGKK
jgi:hypothetical protein